MDGFLKDDFYRFIFKNSLDAILLTSPDGKVFRANPAACEMFQRTEEEICKAGRAGLVDMEDPRLAIALQERAAKGNARAELTFLRSDGSRFPVDCTSAIFKDDEGKSWTAMIIRDITLFKETEERLLRAQEETAYFAAYDHLTGVLNRRTFVDNLVSEMNRTKRKNAVMCLMLLDIDWFKQVNDRFGHLNGDSVLKYLALLLTENLRPYDAVGRYGGDEFIVCLPDTGLREAADIAERIRSIIEQTEIRHESMAIKITSSIGVVAYDYTSHDDADALISKADNNMYRAKEQRNCVFAQQA